MKKNLNETELETVTGGDNCDNELEYSDTPEGVRYLYNIGDRVEVYNSTFHVATETGIITNRWPISHHSGCETHYCGRYEIQILQTNKFKYETATGIERKS